MKRAGKLLVLLLVFCTLLVAAPLQPRAEAEWVQVSFTTVDNAIYLSSADRSSDRIYRYYYSEPASTLIIRGKGDMPEFDERHPIPWKDLRTRVKRVILDADVASISAHAFEDFTELTSVVFPPALGKIGQDAFKGCIKLKLIDVVGKHERAEDIADLIEASGSVELKKASLLLITPCDLRDEIARLTLWWRDEYCVRYDRAGRPIHITLIRQDGSKVETDIEYLNETATDTKAEDTTERSYTVITAPDGRRAAIEIERNDYGQKTIETDTILNPQGRAVAGQETDLYGTYESKLEEAHYNPAGYGTREWKQVFNDGSFAEILEVVGPDDRILSVNTTYYDWNGQETGNSELVNSYDIRGNLVSKSVTGTEGGNTFTEDTAYSYDSKNQLVSVSSESTTNGSVSETSDISYLYDQKGNLINSITETTDETGTTQEIHHYEYTGSGKKDEENILIINPDGSQLQTELEFDAGERIVKEMTVETDSDGKETVIVRSNDYRLSRVISSSTEKITYPDGRTATVTQSYDKDGRVTGSSRVTRDATGKTIQTEKHVVSYDAEGHPVGTKWEVRDADGKLIDNDNYKQTYDADGRVIGETSTWVDSAGKTHHYSEDLVYDSNGRIKMDTIVSVNGNGDRYTEIILYTYNADGSYTVETRYYYNDELVSTSSSLSVTALSASAVAVDEEEAEAEPEVEETETEGESEEPEDEDSPGLTLLRRVATPAASDEEILAEAAVKEEESEEETEIEEPAEAEEAEPAEPEEAKEEASEDDDADPSSEPVEEEAPEKKAGPALRVGTPTISDEELLALAQQEQEEKEEEDPAQEEEEKQDKDEDEEEPEESDPVVVVTAPAEETAPADEPAAPSDDVQTPAAAPAVQEDANGEDENSGEAGYTEEPVVPAAPAAPAAEPVAEPAAEPAPAYEVPEEDSEQPAEYVPEVIAPEPPVAQPAPEQESYQPNTEEERLRQEEERRRKKRKEQEERLRRWMEELGLAG